MPPLIHSLALLSPADVSARGEAVDQLFLVFGIVCAVVLLIVHAALLIALSRRNSTGGKGSLIHQFGWGLAALGGLIALFIASERTWQHLRADRNADSIEPQHVLVVGERFEWSVIYPGEDGVLGRYLIFPKAKDENWANPNIVDATTAAAAPPFTFRGVVGPAELGIDDREDAIAAYVEQINPLGKDFTDPAGWDDDWRSALGRPVVVEVNRPVEVRLGSKDAIHDFFVPAMRVKLDAVPGLLGTVRFTPTTVGTYDLLCGEYCGWGHSEMLGQVVVKESP